MVLNTIYKKLFNTTKTKKAKQTKYSKYKKHSKSSHYYNTHTHSHKLYEKKNDILKFQFIPKLKGGRFIDKGGFGCVVNPAIPCSSSDTNLDKYVSKIIKLQTSELKNEIEISIILNNIDPEHKYYTTINNKCIISSVPSDRTDIVSVKYKDDDLTQFENIDVNQNGEKKIPDSKYCDVDLELKPVNLIMPYAGISLSNVMKTDKSGKAISNVLSKIKRQSQRQQSKRQQSKMQQTMMMKNKFIDTSKGKDLIITTGKEHRLIIAQMHKMFIDNLKLYFKHLIIGLLKMHNSRIVNKDIKPKNIMLYWKDDVKQPKPIYLEPIQQVSNPMSISYIDFGISKLLTSEVCKDTLAFDLKGTPKYMSPELFICSIMVIHKNKPKTYQIRKIIQYINKNVRESLKLIGETEMAARLNQNIDALYKKIEYLFENQKLLIAYYGSDKNKFNGFLQKADVYALGFSIFECLYKYSNIDVQKNEKIYDLLLHMLAIDPDKRYNVYQCLSHPYFR